jgi:hypothetical protein
MIPEFIIELLKNGIVVELELKNDKIGFKIDGFYKSGSVTLIQEDDDFIAYARYNETELIHNLADLACYNKYWWSISKERSDCWKQPDKKWLPILLKFNLITSKAENHL